MVKLKRLNEETQLDLFSWKPKEVSKPEEYDGLSDTDVSKWFNPSYLNNKFNEYNKRFFSNRLTKIPVYIKTKDKALGVCVGRAIRSRNFVESTEIYIADKKFKNRYSMENILVHEMCHAYQTEIFCKNTFSLYADDCKKGSGSHGHGPFFFKAADLVNNSPDNIEGFHITQYNEDIDTAVKRLSSSSGYVFIRPSLDGVTIYTIADNRNNREQIRFSSQENLFTYRDTDTKSIITSIFGRSTKYIYPYHKIIKQICDKIISGDLIPVVEESKLDKLYIQKDLNEISIVKNKPSNNKEVFMNDPFSILQNRMNPNSKVNLTEGLSPVTRRFREAESFGVYSISESKLESTEINMDKVEKEVENADNTLDIVDLGNGVEEIFIE